MSNPLLTDILVGDTPGMRWAKLNAWMSYLATNISTGTGLPSQGGNSGKFLTTDGTTASWAALAGGGNVSNTGTPTSGQVAEWTNATTVQGVAVTGTGNYVKATSPTLVTPLLGTPTSVTLTNATGLPISTGVSGLGANVATFLATPSSANLIAAVTDETGSGALVFATSPTLVTPILGTPTSGTLTNCTLPVGGLTGLGTGVATFLATPSSANLLAALTDETGTGVAVFGTSPTFTTSVLTGSTTFALINTTATTVNAFGAATTLNMGNASGTTNLLGIVALNGATASASTTLIVPAGTTAVSSLRIPHGAAPTSPVNGDIWTTTSALFIRINGSTVQVGTGSGTVTVVGAGSLTSTALVTGGGSQTLQTPAATATMDSSGNISTPGSISTGVGSGLAGFIEFTQGTAPSAGTTSIKLYAPASVTSYIRNLPAAAGTGFYYGTNASGVVSDTQVAANGTGNVLLASGTIAITSGKTVTFDHTSTFTTTDSQVYTFPTTTATLARTDAANTFTGASTTTSWAMTTQVVTGGLTASGSGANTFAGSTGTFITSTGANTISGAATFNSTLSMGGTALTFGALPSGATTAGALATFAAQTYTVTGTNTATAFQGIYHGVVTITDASVGTVTDLFNENWAGPAAVAGSLVVTRAHTLGILDATSASSSITGGLIVAAVYGTTATSVGIGGGNVNAGGNGTFGGTLAVTGHTTFEGVTSTGATGTGKLVYDTSPTLATAVLGSSTATTQTAGDASTKVSTTAYSDRNSQLQYNAQTGTTYTLVLADGTPGSSTAGVSMSNASANTLTVPTNASVAFPIGWTIPILNAGAAATTIAAAGGVTINAPGGLLTLGTQYSSGVLNKTGTNTWQWYGASLPAVVASNRATAQSAANSSIVTYTVGAADSSFNVSANMNVSASTALATTLTCTYTDESNTARSMIFPIQQLTGSFIALGAITGTGAWESPVMHIRCKASTAITILTSTGTFTGVTYTAEGVITQTR